MKKYQREIIELIIAACLILTTWSLTRNYRNEQVVIGMQAQSQLGVQMDGIEKTKIIIQEGLNNGGKINLQALNSIGWNFTFPIKADTSAGFSK